MLRACDVDDAISPYCGFVQGEPEVIVEVRCFWPGLSSSRRTRKLIAINAAEVTEAAAEEIAEMKVAEKILG